MSPGEVKKLLLLPPPRWKDATNTGKRSGIGFYPTASAKILALSDEYRALDLSRKVSLN